MNYANVIRNESKNYSGRKFCETNSTSIIIVQQIISLDPFPMASTSSFDKIKQKKIHSVLFVSHNSIRVIELLSFADEKWKISAQAIFTIIVIAWTAVT